MSAPHRRDAITLLEMAIALFVLFMFLGLVAVQIRGHRERQELDYAARRVQLSLRELHHKSIRQQQTVQMRIDWKNNRLLWSELKKEMGTDSEGQPREKWSEFKTLYDVADPVKIVKMGDRREEAAEVVYFFPDGRCTAAAYRLEHSKTRETISLYLIDWSGEVELSSNS
jgi:Tfp pilus assembly protein FimT